jgi:transaldolase
MKFFVDSADIREIRQAVDWGVCDGVTTNPSLVAATGRSLADVVADITSVVDGPISVEATALDAEGLFAQAGEIGAVHPNIVVKIPMTRDGMQAVRRCAGAGIKTNVTLVFSPIQALLAAKAGATFVSPFIGRLDDIATDGMTLVQDIQTIYGNYLFDTEVIVASVRHPMHVLEAARMGADICTIPFGVLKKLYDHPLTDIGIERFLKDWEKVPGKNVK